MLFGTPIGYVPGSVGVVPGTLTMQLGDPRIATCPPDPVWNYFPPIGQMPTYASPVEQCNPQVIPAPPIHIMPPNLPPTTSQEPTTTRPTTVRNPPVQVVQPVPPPINTPPRPPTRWDKVQDKLLKGTHDLLCANCGVGDGVLMPYANDVRLSGLGDAPLGPFGMTWGGFLGVVGLALAGGIGLGYLSRQ